MPASDSARSTRHLHVVRRRAPGFPIPLTGFVGREREIVEVGRLLGRTRLLTLTGAGGSGKTRLSIEAATAALDAFPDGAAWVELAPLNDPALVPQVVASALEVRPQPGREIVDSLTANLVSRRFLLVLDNCEHLLESCAALASSLLQSCPELRVLATSREALRIAGEVTWRVPPLSLPDSSAGLEALERSEAVRLFDERARAVLPSFELDDGNAGDVARICQRLEGIPLAIELAAARVRLLAPAQIADRLDDCFALLTGGTRDAAPRQQTLRAAIDWSYDLLTEAERRLFASLSIFAGGFTLDAAEAVCGADGIPADELLDLLTHLVDKSLVVVEERGGEARCRMLETIRQYAEERLVDSEEAEAVGRRHATYYIGIAEAAEPDLQGARQAVVMDRLEEEHDNLRAALRWLVKRREGLLAARLGGAVWRFWQTRGYLGEGRQWLSEVLAASAPPEGGAGSEELQGARGKALQGAGVLAWGQGEYDRAAELFEEALALFEALRDDDGVAALRNNLGVIALHRGDFSRATELFESSLVLRRQQGHTTGIGTTLNNLGATAGKQGDLASARRYYEESLALQRQHGNVQGAAISLSNLGATAYGQGHYAEAHRFFSEGLELRQLLGDRTGVADSFAKLGRVALGQGEHERARAYYAASLPLLRELGDRERIASGMMGIGALALARGEVGRAVRLLGAADAIRAEIGAPLTAEERTDQERYVAAAQERMGEAALETVRAEGRALPLQAALELAEEELAESMPVAGEEGVSADGAAGGTAGAGVPDAGSAATGPGAGADRTADAASARAAPTDAAAAAGSAGFSADTAAGSEVGAARSSAGAAARPADLRILALGPVEVWRDGRTVTAAEWGSAKPRELLFYLLCHPAGRTKEQIGLALWPEASPAQLRNSFHVTLHHLRRALGGAAWIVFDNDRYRFDRSLAYEYDVEVFEAHLAEAERLRRDPDADPRRVIDALETALRGYRGDFLEETLFGDWVMETQDALRRHHVDALLVLADLHTAAGDQPAAADAWRRALARDRLLERAHRGLILCLARQGDRDRALAQYRVLEALLRDEIGAAPQAETRALHERLLRGETP